MGEAAAVVEPEGSEPVAARVTMAPPHPVLDDERSGCCCFVGDGGGR